MKNEHQKEMLLAEIDKYKSMLEIEVSEKKDILTKTAIVVGIVTAGYALTKLVISGDSEDEKAVPETTKKESSGIGKLAMGILTPLAISFAKGQLTKLVKKK